MYGPFKEGTFPPPKMPANVPWTHVGPRGADALPRGPRVTSRSSNPEKAAKEVTDRAAADVSSGDHLAVIVDSPPGAGKSTFVVGTAATLAKQQDQVPIVAQTNAQADDLVRSLLRQPGT